MTKIFRKVGFQALVSPSAVVREIAVKPQDRDFQPVNRSDSLRVAMKTRSLFVVLLVLMSITVPCRAQFPKLLDGWQS
jgi:hypothetical protein